MQVTELAWEETFFPNRVTGKNRQAYLCQFATISNRTQYRMWWYPPDEIRDYDTYSLWRLNPLIETKHTPVFRVECELVAQCILYEVTANVSLEDVRVWRPDPSSVEGRARQAIEAVAGSDPNGAGKDHRSRIRRIRDGASGLGDSPFWAACWKMARALISRTMVH